MIRLIRYGDYPDQTFFNYLRIKSIQDTDHMVIHNDFNYSW